MNTRTTTEIPKTKSVAQLEQEKSSLFNEICLINFELARQRKLYFTEEGKL
jgi:hypothetical protein